MGRSVDVLSNYRHVTYFEYPVVEYDDFVDGEGWGPEEWKWVLENLAYSIGETNLELDLVKNKWDGGEVSILFENAFCQIGFSEYAGLCSFAIRVNEEHLEHLFDDEQADAIKYSEDWIDEYWPIICKAIGYKLLVRVGGFSDGTSVYELKDKEV